MIITGVQSDTMKELLSDAHSRATRYLDSLASRPVEPDATAVANLQKVYPSFTIETLAKELKFWNFPEKDRTHMLDGLRKAGLDISDKQTAAD